MASAGEGRGDAFRQEIRQRQQHRARGLEAALGRARLLASRLDEEGHLDSEEKREALLSGVYAGMGVGRLLQHAKELHEMAFERRAQEADLRRAALLGQQAALSRKGEDGAPEEGVRDEEAGGTGRVDGAEVEEEPPDERQKAREGRRSERRGNWRKAVSSAQRNLGRDELQIAVLQKRQEALLTKIEKFGKPLTPYKGQFALATFSDFQQNSAQMIQGLVLELADEAVWAARTAATPSKVQLERVGWEASKDPKRAAMAIPASLALMQETVLDLVYECILEIKEQQREAEEFASKVLARSVFGLREKDSENPENPDHVNKALRGLLASIQSINPQTDKVKSSLVVSTNLANTQLDRPIHCIRPGVLDPSRIPREKEYETKETESGFWSRLKVTPLHGDGGGKSDITYQKAQGEPCCLKATRDAAYLAAGTSAGELLVWDLIQDTPALVRYLNAAAVRKARRGRGKKEAKNEQVAAKAGEEEEGEREGESDSESPKFPLAEEDEEGTLSLEPTHWSTNLDALAESRDAEKAASGVGEKKPKGFAKFSRVFSFRRRAKPDLADEEIELPPPEAPPSVITSIAWSSDNRQLAFASPSFVGTGSMILGDWDDKEAKQGDKPKDLKLSYFLKPIPNFTRPALSGKEEEGQATYSNLSVTMAFSPLMSVTGTQPLVLLPRHDGTVLQLSQDKGLPVLRIDGQDVKVASLLSEDPGRALLTPPVEPLVGEVESQALSVGHQKPVVFCDFEPTGGKMVTVDQEGVVGIWDGEPKDYLGMQSPRRYWKLPELKTYCPVSTAEQFYPLEDPDKNKKRRRGGADAEPPPEKAESNADSTDPTREKLLDTMCVWLHSSKQETAGKGRNAKAARVREVLCRPKLLRGGQIKFVRSIYAEDGTLQARQLQKFASLPCRYTVCSASLNTLGTELILVVRFEPKQAGVDDRGQYKHYSVISLGLDADQMVLNTRTPQIDIYDESQGSRAPCYKLHSLVTSLGSEYLFWCTGAGEVGIYSLATGLQVHRFELPGVSDIVSGLELIRFGSKDSGTESVHVLAATVEKSKSVFFFRLDSAEAQAFQIAQRAAALTETRPKE